MGLFVERASQQTLYIFSELCGALGFWASLVLKILPRVTICHYHSATNLNALNVDTASNALVMVSHRFFVHVREYRSALRQTLH